MRLHALVAFLVCDLTMKSFDDRAAALFRKSEQPCVFHWASHRLPTIVRHFLERRAIAIALRHVRRLRPRSSADFVEQLTDKTERVNLIVVPAGRKTEQLGPQVRKPRCALPHIEAEHRHASAHGLRAHGLVAAAHELLAGCVGVCTENSIRFDT